ncbi:unnamed protein product [Durusdinium trenchii]|uniref:EF-hand domain-containing protein n=1 Tax=Durusdinium trenchii TaxID=1381693 RepID=A0ABP0R6B5_9DINO
MAIWRCSLSHTPSQQAAWSHWRSPPHHEFFGGRSVERLRQISPNDFDERIRLGKPFIIEDAGENLDLVGSTCQQFHERFPSAKMRAEYSGGRREMFVSLGSKAWFEKDRPQRALQDLPGSLAATNAPYVWHVKDGGHEAPPEVRAAVQEAWQPPYFVRGAVNLREANESAEFWFHRRNGAVMAHADTYCIPAVSLQITGQKHWRLMPHPKVHFSRDAPEPHDGGIYGADWLPFWEATVQQGEAIVFFPNIFHETHVPEDNPECTVATTFQIQLPIPARYLRAYLPTFAMSHLYYEGHCRDLWDPYATLRPPKAAKATTKEAAIEKEHASLVASIDDDEDGFISLEELEAFLSAQRHVASAGRLWAAPWPRWFYSEDYFYDWRPESSLVEEMQAELLKARIQDSMAYLDCCPADGFVSSFELFSALRQWHVVHKRLQAAERLRLQGKQHKVHKLELDFATKLLAKLFYQSKLNSSIDDVFLPRFSHWQQ